MTEIRNLVDDYVECRCYRRKRVPSTYYSNIRKSVYLFVVMIPHGSYLVVELL